MLGVNIISYSTVLDVLLSPLVLLIDNVALMVATVIMPVVAYLYLKLIRYFTAKTKKEIKLKSHNLVTDSMKNQVFVMTAIMIFSGFVGFGIGNGFEAKEKLGKSELKPNHEVDFRNGETKSVHMVGSNSGFLFYVEENANVVTISPFQENILALKKLPKKKEGESDK